MTINFLNNFNRNEKGYVFPLVIIAGIAILVFGIITVRNTNLSMASSNVQKNKVQAFYASDGAMNFISEEIIDGNSAKYITSVLNIGGQSINGTIKDSTSKLYVQSCGTGFADNQDNLLYVYKKIRPTSGDVDLSVKIDTILDGTYEASSGIMIREDTSSGARFATLAVSRSGKVIFSSRTTPNSSISTIDTYNGHLPIWLRIVRNGNNNKHFAYYSYSGTNWHLINTTTVDMVKNALLGLVNYSKLSGTTSKAIFSNVKGAKFTSSYSSGWMVNAFDVQYKIVELSKNSWSIETNALRKDNSGNIIYSSPLEQVYAPSYTAYIIPDTLWMHVIYYDYHADESNPEFERPHDYGTNLIAQTNMVKTSTLENDMENASYFNQSSIAKPVFDTTNVRHQYYLKYWFRPWITNAKGDFTKPNYATAIVSGWLCETGRLAFPPTLTLPHDTSFKNIVFKDSLPLANIGGGLFQFSRRGSSYGEPYFFPLDGKGFGSEGKIGPDNLPHNYGFTMEAHAEFLFEKGLRFMFNGDDDVWIFINRKLAIDLGGIHYALGDTVHLDSIATAFNLVEGNKYVMDLFYAERQSNESTIQITTNMKFAYTVPYNKSWRKNMNF